MMKLSQKEDSITKDDNIPVIRLENVSKVYISSSGIKFWALKGVNLDIWANEYISIMGPSGHGKTTLLNMIGLLDRPSEGKVYIDGIDTSTLSDAELSAIRNRKIGFVFQQFNLITRMNILENVELPLMVRKIPRKRRIEMVIEAIKKAGGDESWIHKRPTQLSGGEQQRVAIARAIVGDPGLILADEPTGNLDSVSAKVVMETFSNLIKLGKTIVVVTHALEIASCTDKIYLIRDGRIIGERKPNKNDCILYLGD
jgi:putative ABC transport system ATP-binding protein